MQPDILLMVDCVCELGMVRRLHAQKLKTLNAIKVAWDFNVITVYVASCRAGNEKLVIYERPHCIYSYGSIVIKTLISFQTWHLTPFGSEYLPMVLSLYLWITSIFHLKLRFS